MVKYSVHGGGLSVHGGGLSVHGGEFSVHAGGRPFSQQHEIVFLLYIVIFGRSDQII